MTLALDHIAIPAADPAAAQDLFGNVLGLPLLAAYDGDDWGGKPWLMMIYGLPDGRQVALCARAGARVARSSFDLPHYAFAVENRAALRRWRARLAQAGLAVRDEDHGRQRSIYFEDRGGTTWEITAPPSRTPRDRAAPQVVERWLALHGSRRRSTRR